MPGLVAEGVGGHVSLGGELGFGATVDLEAIGAPDKLTGSLTRSGGVIAQLAATQPAVVVTVTPMDRLELPATDARARPGPWSTSPLIP